MKEALKAPTRLMNSPIFGIKAASVSGDRRSYIRISSPRNFFSKKSCGHSHVRRTMKVTKRFLARVLPLSTLEKRTGERTDTGT